MNNIYVCAFIKTVRIPSLWIVGMALWCWPLIGMFLGIIESSGWIFWWAISPVILLFFFLVGINIYDSYKENFKKCLNKKIEFDEFLSTWNLTYETKSYELFPILRKGELI